MDVANESEETAADILNSSYQELLEKRKRWMEIESQRAEVKPFLEGKPIKHLELMAGIDSLPSYIPWDDSTWTSRRCLAFRYESHELLKGREDYDKNTSLYRILDLEARVYKQKIELIENLIARHEGLPVHGEA